LVLVIDDDPSARELIVRSLEAEHIMAVTASSGAEGLQLARELDEIVVAMPDGKADDILSGYCFDRGWSRFRGPEDDVLTRYLYAAETFKADIVVRVTADCPLIDPFVIDSLVLLFKSGGYDFVANNLEPTFPHGMDAEVMSRGTLAIASAEATSAYDREHVTPWITRAGAGGSIFRLCNLPCPLDLSRYRLTVDFQEDLELIREIYAHFYASPYIQVPAVTTFLESRPDLMALNAKHRKPAAAIGQA